MTSRPTPVGTPVDPPKPPVLEAVRKRRRRRQRRGLAVAAAAAIGAWPLAWSLAATPQAQTSPGAFSGSAFDTCQAPSAATMDAWLKDPTDPYRGIGIYISGSLRACSQPNLTSAWVSHVQATGWHLLPLTAGPQASCTGFSQTINSNPAGIYAAARQQGAAQADGAVAAARALGINPGSTLFYDMENWHTGYNDCDASTLWFMSAWTNRLHAYGYAGGVYVSGSSGGQLLNAMAANPPANYVLPDQIWVAEWNNQANVSSSYISPGVWVNHQRVHQYYGGHNATYGGITLNIDSDFADVAPISPIPAVVPDSAIGALPSWAQTTAPAPQPKPSQAATPKPIPSASPSATAATPTKPSATAPTATATAPAKPGASPSSPSTQPTASASSTPSDEPAPSTTTTSEKTPISPPTSTAPDATPSTATTTPKTPQIATKVSGVTPATANDAGGSTSAMGIQAPVKAAAPALSAKQADKVPLMSTKTLAQPSRVVTKTSTNDAVRVDQSAQVSQASMPAPLAEPAAPDKPLQPSLPFSAPKASEPSLMTKLWQISESALSAVGHALAAACGWVGRGIGSMLGW